MTSKPACFDHFASLGKSFCHSTPARRKPTGKLPVRVAMSNSSCKRELQRSRVGLCGRNAAVSMRLEEVVPWGRSMWEYTHMFDLDEAALSSQKILGVGDGPASFNAEMHELGRRVV